MCLCNVVQKKANEERENAKSDEVRGASEKKNTKYIHLCVGDVHLAHQWPHTDREGQQER